MHILERLPPGGTMRRLTTVLIMLAVAACGGDVTSPASPESDPQDPDTDDDGILNALDACPSQPETVNNVFDTDGCPDTSMDLYNVVRTDVEAYWGRTFSAGGLVYQPISVFQSYSTPIASPCGPAVLNNAFYCPVNMGVYFDLGFMDSFLAGIGDMAPAFIISHEIGHHASNLLGWTRPLISGKQSELQADCFGGAWTLDVFGRGLLETGDLEEAVTALINVADPDVTWLNPNEHGTPTQRVAAFAIGLQQGVAGCTSADFLIQIPSPALSFDGASQFVEVPDHSDLDLSSTWTLEAWIAPTDVARSNFQHVISKWNGGGDASYTLEIRAGHLRAGIHDGATTWAFESTGLLVNDVWQHVAITFDNGLLSLYIDGVLDAAWTGVPTPMNSTRPVSLGREGPPFNSRYYAGLMDEVRMWSVARSGVELAGAMHALLSGTEAGLVGYWRFNEGEGDVAYDLTQRGHEGRLGSAVGPDANDPLWWSPGAPVPADIARGN
jgi:predicted metalloprotease